MRLDVDHADRDDLLVLYTRELPRLTSALIPRRGIASCPSRYRLPTPCGAGSLPVRVSSRGRTYLACDLALLAPGRSFFSVGRHSSIAAPTFDGPNCNEFGPNWLFVNTSGWLSVCGLTA